MDLAASLLLILVCLALSAFFSGSETALLRLRGHELEDDVKAARGPAAVAARDLLRSTSRLLVTILFGNNVANILGASVASALAVAHLGAESGILVATITMTFLVLVFCEILPKAVAARHPRGLSYAVSLPLYLLHQLMRPVHILFDRVIDPLMRQIGGGEGEEGPSPEDVLRLALTSREGEGRGTPLAIIGAAAGAADMTVEEILVPRTEVVAFPVQTDPNELLERVLEERYTRVPIYEGSIDRILGVVHLKDLIKLGRDNGGDLQSILKPVLRVPARKPILRLLEDMQRAFVHLAVVKDEFDVTLGIVTQEDVLEELVGEIRDEFDREELMMIRRLPDGSYRSLGRIKVLDFNRQTGWDVPAEPGDTLGGLVFNHLGRSPRRGDVVRVPGYDLTVADMSGNRITEIRISARPAAKAPREATA